MDRAGYPGQWFGRPAVSAGGSVDLITPAIRSVGGTALINLINIIYYNEL
jgi:hypothetical protein